MERISKELMGASSNMFVLSILQKGDSYGYKIMQDIKEFSGGRIIWKEGSLYPVLKKLEKSKKIKSYWNVEDFGRPRKYYKILAKGEKALKQELEDWDIVRSSLNKILVSSQA